MQSTLYLFFPSLNIIRPILSKDHRMFRITSFPMFHQFHSFPRFFSRLNLSNSSCNSFIYTTLPLSLTLCLSNHRAWRSLHQFPNYLSPLSSNPSLVHPALLTRFFEFQFLRGFNQPNNSSKSFSQLLPIDRFNNSLVQQFLDYLSRSNVLSQTP